MIDHPEIETPQLTPQALKRAAKRDPQAHFEMQNCQRLGSALKANMMKRKQQQRARAAAPTREGEEA